VEPATTSRRTGLALLIGVAFAWGLNWPMIKLGVSEVPVWQFRAYTGLIAAAALFGFARLLRQNMAVAPRFWIPLTLAALLNVTSWFMLIAYGVKLMGSSHAAILAFTMPIFQAVLGVFFLGEVMTARRVLALASGIAGVLVLLSHDFDALGTNPIGALILLIGAFNWAVGVIVQKRVVWPVGALALAGWQLLIGCLPILAVSLLLESFVYHQASWPALAASVYLTLIAFVFAYYAWFAVVQLFPAHIAALGSLLVPVIGVISSALLVDEPFGWREVVSLVLITGAVALVLFTPGAAAPADAPARIAS
jgi:drug/metabolite transporter (DMT)-like permease